MVNNPTLSETNPKSVIQLIKILEEDVKQWLVDLEQIRQEIQTLYREGPILEAWLESEPCVKAKDGNIKSVTTDSPESTHPSTRIQYRICSLDDDNKIHSRPCPATQLAEVSMAIARYQKLRLLLQKKEKQEQKLQQLAQSLTLIHNQFKP